jgi:3-methyl-2-oxobutanoate hydroxymethyltransferase
MLATSPVTAATLLTKKRRGEKITMLTAYDATFAALFDHTGIDVLLVGDSLGMVIQGHPNTLPVKLEHMIYHTAAVSRVVKQAHVVGDLPFMSYQVSPEQAVESAGRLVQEGGAHAVKLEGGREMTAQVERIAASGVPVMGHIGLTPQSVHRMGGFRVQGKDNNSARRLLEDARALQAAGCYSIVLEGMPAELAAEITRALSIPTIGIGAGVGCDGQVLVSYDLLGLNPDFRPKFVKAYAQLHAQVTAAVHAFADEVRSCAFPAEEHSFHADLRVVTGEAKSEGSDRSSDRKGDDKGDGRTDAKGPVTNEVKTYGCVR